MLKSGVYAKMVSECLGHSIRSIALDLYSHSLPGLQAADWGMSSYPIGQSVLRWHRARFSDMFIRPVLRWWDRTFPLVLGDTEIFLRPESLHVRLVPERLVR
jgi:hypothetical protein